MDGLLDSLGSLAEDAAWVRLTHHEISYGRRAQKVTRDQALVFQLAVSTVIPYAPMLSQTHSNIGTTLSTTEEPYHGDISWVLPTRNPEQDGPMRST